MKEAGIDVDKFKPHSTRSAAASKAKRKEVPIQDILDAAMWKSHTTFAKFYDKDCVAEKEKEATVQNAILRTA